MKRVMSVFCDLLLSIFLGMKPFVVISDVNLAKEISVKHFDKFMNRFVSGCMCTCFLKYASNIDCITVAEAYYCIKL